MIHTKFNIDTYEGTPKRCDISHEPIKLNEHNWLNDEISDQ